MKLTREQKVRYLREAWPTVRRFAHKPAIYILVAGVGGFIWAGDIITARIAIAVLVVISLCVLFVAGLYYHLSKLFEADLDRQAAELQVQQAQKMRDFQPTDRRLN